MKQSPLIIAFLSLFILTACGVQAPIEGENQTEVTNLPEPAPQEIESGSEIQPDPLEAPEEVEEVYQPYKLVDKSEVNPVPGEPFIEQNLVKVDPVTKEETVLFENLFKKHELNFQTVRGVIEGSNKLILSNFRPETDQPSSFLFSLDVDTFELKKLSINEIPHQTYVDRLSPDGKYLAWVPYFFVEEGDEASKKLYLVDLINDSYSVLVELPEVETLSSSAGWPEDSLDFEWIDEDTLKYAVYNYKDGNESDRSLIEYREVTLK